MKSEYFIIPRFNGKFNFEKFNRTNIPNISLFHGKYTLNKICYFFLHTNISLTASDVRSSFQKVPTVCAKNYIIPNNDLKIQKNTIYICNIPSFVQSTNTISQIASTFGEADQTENINNHYFSFDFQNISEAKNAAIFMSALPMDFQTQTPLSTSLLLSQDIIETEENNLIISDNPFKIPAIAIKRHTYFKNILQLIQSRYHVLDVFDTTKFHVLVLQSLEVAENIIKNFNFGKYGNEEIRISWFVPEEYEEMLNKYRVIVSNSEDVELYMFQAKIEKNIGKVYQIEKIDKKTFSIIFQKQKCINKLFKLYPSAYLAEFCAYTIFNFPPKTKCKTIETFLINNKIAFESVDIHKCPNGISILPSFDVLIPINENEKFSSFFGEKNVINDIKDIISHQTKTKNLVNNKKDKNVYFAKSHLFCLSTYRIDINAALDLFGTKCTTISLKESKISKNEYRKYSEYGFIKMFKVDEGKGISYITYEDISQRLAAERALITKQNQSYEYIPPPNQFSIQITKKKKEKEQTSIGNIFDKNSFPVPTHSHTQLSSISSDNDVLSDNSEEFHYQKNEHELKVEKSIKLFAVQKPIRKDINNQEITFNPLKISKNNSEILFIPPNKDENATIFNPPNKDKTTTIFNPPNKDKNEPIFNPPNKDKTTTIFNPPNKDKTTTIFNPPNKDKNEPIFNPPNKGEKTSKYNSKESLHDYSFIFQ